MRAGRVTFLFGLALIHVSLADIPTKEEELEKLADGDTIIEGYVFNGDEIFTETADSIIQYSAEVMKNRTTNEGRSYTFCNKVGHDIVCLDVLLSNSTNLKEDMAKSVTFESGEVLKAGYIFDGDETFAEKVNVLLNHAYRVMKDCRTKEYHEYKYCTKVGYDIVCLTVCFIPGMDEDFQKDDITGISAGSNPYYKSGSIFDSDEVFAQQSIFLLNHSTRVMRLSLTKIDQSYTICYKVDPEIICMSVWLSRSEHEFINDIYGINDFGIKPHGGRPDFLNMEGEDTLEFPEGSDIDDKFGDEENAMEDFEEEDHAMEDMAEEN